MCYRKLFTIFVGWLILVASIPADIVWSGTQYQRAYHDLPALDFNQDGTNDFTFDQVFIPEFLDRQIWIQPAGGQIVITSDSDFLVPNGIALVTGTAIGSDLNNLDYAWESANTFLFAFGTVEGNPSVGGFFADGDGYLGVSFNVEGSTHYGWIELSHNKDKVWPSPDDPYLYVQGWAWETEADTAIIAGAVPEPSSGILTMVGSLALLQLARSRRRRRKQTHKPVFGYRSPQELKDPEKW